MDTIQTGRIISQKRKELGLTQIQLAEILKVSNRAVSKWENGDGYPDITILPDISKALGITIDELLTGEKPIQSEPDKKDTEKKLLNDFKLCFTISLLLSIFAALLGGVTEIYSIWAFNILFYTHWEIIFAAASLALLIMSVIVFVIGAIRLNLEFSKDEIVDIVHKKSALLAAISLVFPYCFIARIIDYSRFGVFMPYFMAILIIISVVMMWMYVKRDFKNETKN